MTAFCETLLTEVSQKLGVRMDIVHTSTAKLFVDFERVKYVGIVSMMLPQSTGLGGVPFITSTPLYRLGPVLIVNKKNPYKTLNEMAGKIDALAGEARVEINIEEYPEVIFSGYSNISQAFADLNNQRIDGVIVDSLQAKSYARGLYANKFIISDFTLTTEGILLILHKTKETEHFMELFNQELKRLRDTGLYINLLKAWRVAGEWLL